VETLTVQQAFYHFVYLTVHSGKVTVEHDFFLSFILEGVDLRKVGVGGFLLLDLPHIEVGLAKILGGPKVCKTN
jgi:hypothetical protein